MNSIPIGRTFFPETFLGKLGLVLKDSLVAVQ